MNRAAQRATLFHRDADCALFLDILADMPERFSAHIHGYALMPNHFHLMVEVPHGNLSAMMQVLGQEFTQAYNRRHGIDGPLFRGRFKNRLVQDDAYWMHLLAYLHLNPVRARLVKKPGNCLWTSYNAYSGVQPRPDWLTTDALLEAYGSAAAHDGYLDGLTRKKREPPAGFDNDRLWTKSSAVPSPDIKPVKRQTFEDTVAEIAKLRSVPVSEVFARHRGPKPNTTYWLAVWWLNRATGHTNSEIARRLEVARPRIGQILRRVQELAKTDAKLRSQMDQLSSSLKA